MRILLLALFVSSTSLALAQGPPNDAPRVDDHFWRRRVEMSIDLYEKINKPLITEENRDAINYTWTEGNSALHFKKGIIYALLHLYMNGEIQGYKTDTLDAPYEWSDFENFVVSIDEAPSGVEEAEFPEDEDDGVEVEDDFDMGDFGDMDFGDDLDFGDDAMDVEEPTDQNQNSDKTIQTWIQNYEFDRELKVIEDRIFDKNKSSMYYDIKYLQIYVPASSTNPVIAGKKMVTFHYDEIEEYLDNINWKNPYNDSEYRTLKEVFELRRFNSVDYNISGRVSMSLPETAYRREKMINYEHSLWEY